MFKSFSQDGNPFNEVIEPEQRTGNRSALPPIHYPSSLFAETPNIDNNSHKTTDNTADKTTNRNSALTASTAMVQGISDASYQASTDLPNHANDHTSVNVHDNVNSNDHTERGDQRLRAKRVVEAVEQIHNYQSPTPLTDRYLAHRQNFRHPNRPPFAAATLWPLKHGTVPIMTELVTVVDVPTLNAMPIEAVAILDRINQKLKRYREWSDELSGEQVEWVCERQYVIDKLIDESIPEALSHYEQLLRFSPHRTKNNRVQGTMTAGDMLTDLFLEIDYELDELLDELHSIVLNRLASTHRYVKSRTQK